MPGFILHLQGPMQSYADTGFGQLREAGLFPSRAAVLGIVAAAMGIPRADERLVRLHEAFDVHVAAARSGRVLKDYHTVETEATRPKTLTWRDYHHDSHFVACLETKDRQMSDQAQQALRRPVYSAFLGRRSCPPAVPLFPVAIQGDAFEFFREATVEASRALPFTGEQRWGPRVKSIAIYLDGHLREAPPAFAGAQLTYGSRRDRLLAPRRAYVSRPYSHLTWPLAGEGERSDEQRAYFDAIR